MFARTTGAAGAANPVLVYRLLALVNSAAYGLRHEIQSLRHALMMLGFTSLARWLREQQAADDHTSDETQAEADLHPVRYAMVMRSRLAQHLLESGAGDDLRAEVYLTALFAELDRLLHKPLGGLIQKLPLSERIFDAVLRASGPYHALLEVARARATPPSSSHCPPSASATRSAWNTPTEACCACSPPAAITPANTNQTTASSSGVHAQVCAVGPSVYCAASSNARRFSCC